MAAFEIDGREYEIPSVFSLNMGEAQVLYDYSGYTLEQFVPPLPEEDRDEFVGRLRNPAFQRAIVHIAYQRGNPTVARDEVSALVETVDMMSVIAALYGQGDEPDPTPTSQNKQQTSSDAEPPSTGESSGRSSSTTADELGATRVPIGTGG